MKRAEQVLFIWAWTNKNIYKYVNVYIHIFIYYLFIYLLKYLFVYVNINRNCSALFIKLLQIFFGGRERPPYIPWYRLWSILCEKCSIHFQNKHKIGLFMYTVPLILIFVSRSLIGWFAYSVTFARSSSQPGIWSLPRTYFLMLPRYIRLLPPIF